MKYHVHLYALVRVKTREIEAESQVEAIEKAEGELRMQDLFNRDVHNHGVALETEYAEEISYAVVDEVGDEEYNHTRNYEPAYGSGDWLLTKGQKPR